MTLNSNDATQEPKLFMVLLGSKAPKRNVEQHDYFFGIGNSLKDLVPQMQAFWPEAGKSLHVDGWRVVTNVDGYRIRVLEKDSQPAEKDNGLRLFFINLGGYSHGRLEEQHYTVLSVHPDKALAIKDSKQTVFFKETSVKGANSHIDEKYGIDVDDVYRIEEILSGALKSAFEIHIADTKENLDEDEIHLGYFKLDKL